MVVAIKDDAIKCGITLETHRQLGIALGGPVAQRVQAPQNRADSIPPFYMCYTATPIGEHWKDNFGTCRMVPDTKARKLRRTCVEGICLGICHRSNESLIGLR